MELHKIWMVQQTRPLHTLMEDEGAKRFIDEYKTGYHIDATLEEIMQIIAETDSDLSLSEKFWSKGTIYATYRPEEYKKFIFSRA